MGLAAWDDIVEFDEPQAQLASFSDVVAVEPPPMANVARFDDIAAIAPPVSIAPTPEEQAIIDASPASQLQRGSVESMFKPAPPPMPGEPETLFSKAWNTIGQPPRLGSAKTGGLASALPGTMPILDAPAEGIPQAGRGIRNLVTGEGGRMNAASDVIEGTMRAGEPLMVAGALVNPLVAARLLATGMAGQAGTARAARALGASPEAERLAGNVGGLVVPGAVEGVHGVFSRPRAPKPGVAPVVEPPAAAPMVEPPPAAVEAPNVAHVTDIVAVEPRVAPKPSIDSLLDRVIDKYAKGEELGSPEARAAFAERSRVENVRKTAAFDDIAEIHAAEPPAPAEPAPVVEEAPAPIAAAEAVPEPAVEPSVEQPAASVAEEPEPVLSRPLGAKREDATGALVPSPASRAIAAVSPEKQLRPSEIVKQLSDSLDELPVRIGKFNQRALGIYKPKAETIRLKVANDLDTLAHELGHHIHETVVGAELPAKTPTWKSELLALGDRTSLASYTDKQRLQEGQAEFTRHWLSDPTTAEARAPEYFKAFEAGLADHPALQTILERAQRQYIGHLAQDPVTRAMSRIDFDGVQANQKGDVVTRFQAAWVDDLAAIKHAVDRMAEGQPVDVMKSGYALARLARGAAAKAFGFIRHGVRDLDGTFIAGALKPALDPIKGRMKEFATYLVASRVPELRARGMETAVSAADAAAALKQLKSPEFDAARKAVYDYQDGMLEYGRRARMFSAEQIQGIKKLNRNYVPFQRVLNQIGEGVGGGGKQGRFARSPIKRIKGSGRDIINPVESIVRNTHTFTTMVEQNRARLALVDQATKTQGGGRFLERIPDKQVATRFNLQQVAADIRAELVNAGVDIPDNLDFDQLVTVFTPSQFRTGESGIVSVLRDGKREWYAVNEPALYDAIEAVIPKESDLFVNLFMRPARWLRAGATTTLSFIARNPIRDTAEAAVNTRYGFKPFLDTARGLFEYAKKGDLYERWLNSGGGSAAMVSGDRNLVRTALKELGLEAKRNIVQTVVHSPMDLLRGMSEAMENATRLGEFKRGYEAETAAGVNPAEASGRAALASRDVTIDFARGGSSSKTANKYVAFFNAGVQGKARLAEVFRRNPVGATLRATTWVTLPSVTLWYLNHDDPEYRELPEWERNIYWHIPIGRREPGHSWVRVPKPFDLGHLFGNAAEAALDFIKKEDPRAAERIFPDKDTAWKQLANLAFTAMMPALEVATNYDTFRDRAIVSPYDLNLDTELQYNRWTSEVAKTVGPKIGLAPAKLDHLIYGYGAGLAKDAVTGIDAILGSKAKPDRGAAGLPGVSAFYRETPRNEAESLQRFYELRDKIAGAEGSVKRYTAAGDTVRAEDRRAQARKDFGANVDAVVERVKEADRQLKELRDGVNAVFASSAFTPADKRQRLNRLYTQMLDVARQGLGKQPLPKPKPPVPEKPQTTQTGTAKP